MKNRNLKYRSLLTAIVILSLNLNAQNQKRYSMESPVVFQAIEIQNDSRSSEQFDKVFKEYTVVEMNPGEIYQYVRSTPSDCPFQLIIGNKFNWTIDLHENEMRTADYRAEETGENGRISIPRTECITYAGKLSNDPSSVVRLNIDSERIWGYVKSQNATIYIEPASRMDVKSDKNRFVIYDTREVIQTSEYSCGAVDLQRESIEHIDMNEAKSMTGNDCRKLDIATESDWEFYDDGETFGDIQGNLNLVEGIYFGQFLMTLRIVYQHQWTTSSDPYSNSLSGCSDFGQLDEFAAYWFNNFGHIRRDINVLYSEKNYEGFTIGCGMTGQFGNNGDNDGYVNGEGQIRGAYCVNEWTDDIFDTEAKRTVLVAHEMGHVLGSGHTATGVMQATIDSDATSFSTSSVTQIETDLNWESTVENDGRSALRTRYFPANSSGDYYMLQPIPGNVSGNEVILDGNSVFLGSTGTFSFSATDKIFLKPGFNTSALSGKNVLIELGGCTLLGD